MKKMLTLFFSMVLILSLTCSTAFATQLDTIEESEGITPRYEGAAYAANSLQLNGSTLKAMAYVGVRGNGFDKVQVSAKIVQQSTGKVVKKWNEAATYNKYLLEYEWTRNYTVTARGAYTLAVVLYGYRNSKLIDTIDLAPVTKTY